MTIYKEKIIYITVLLRFCKENNIFPIPYDAINDLPKHNIGYILQFFYHNIFSHFTIDDINDLQNIISLLAKQKEIIISHKTYKLKLKQYNNINKQLNKYPSFNFLPFYLPIGT
jgi:hypothetical protein